MLKSPFGDKSNISIGDNRNKVNPSTAMTLLTPDSFGLIDLTGTKTGSQMVQNAIAEATHEQYRTLLAKTALENTAALASLGEHLALTVPSGEEHYRTIIGAYAMSAAVRIARW